MKYKILLVLATFMLLTIGIASAVPSVINGDGTTPATVNVIYTINTDTAFNVTIVEGQTTLNFSTYKTAVDVQPNGQNASLSIPWAVIQNSPSAQMTQTFKAKLGAANPAGITLYAASLADFSDAVLIQSTTPQAPTGWYTVAPGNSVKAYFRISTTGSSVTGTNTLAISAVP